MKHYGWMGIVGGLMLAHGAFAAPALKQDQPIEISSDKLDVFQDKQQAVFSGNVIAVQGTTKMRATKMTVFYREGGGDAKPQAAGAPQGIYRIEAQGSVVFTTPTETALGDRGVYNVDADTIDLYGKTVTLTRGSNVLKGTKLNYHMGTGRSVLTGGDGEDTELNSGSAPSGKPKRVHGLFLPQSQSEAKP